MIQVLFCSDTLHHVLLFLPQCHVSTCIFWFLPQNWPVMRQMLLPLGNKGIGAESQVISWVWMYTVTPVSRGSAGSPSQFHSAVLFMGCWTLGHRDMVKLVGMKSLFPLASCWQNEKEHDSDFMAFAPDSWVNRNTVIIFPCFSELAWFSSLEKFSI